MRVLLEVAILGSPLAQKRALILLPWLKDQKETKMGPHSGPQILRSALGSLVNPRETKEEKRMMKNLVKESLHRIMLTMNSVSSMRNELAK
ncbi:unnamed protein product [Lupinus luteus]|uniref:Uncharacterized protein n=1 Tax=Lupinus luteus TaxID=3873 RepID=A0AAV1WVR4_LUPLU